MVKLVTKLVRGKPEKPKKGEPRFYYVNDYMLATPPLAVNQIKKEIVNMAHVAMQNFSAACEIICSLDFSQIETFRDNEKFLDHVNKQLPSYMVKLLKARLNEKDRIYLSTVFRSVSDLERVGDYAENIIEYAEKLRSAQAEFSDNAKEQILKLKNVIDSLFAQSVKAYKDVNLSALKSANEIEDEVDAITAQMNASYIEGLTPEAGACFLSLSSDAERVADHFINVAKTITQTAKGGK